MATRESRSSVARLWTQEARTPSFYVHFSSFHKPNDMFAAELSPVVLVEPVGQMVEVLKDLDHLKRSDINECQGIKG